MRIPARFNGPPGSANGGFACGLVAAELDVASAEVSLRAPPPLETGAVGRARRRRRPGERRGDTRGRGPRRRGGRRPAARAALPRRGLPGGARTGSSAGPPTTRFPPASCAEPNARTATGSRSSRWRSATAGTTRLRGRRSSRAWCGRRSTAPPARPGANWGEGPPIVLARLAVAIDAEPELGEPHVIVSWPLGRDGRKREAAAALFDADRRRARAIARAVDRAAAGVGRARSAAASTTRSCGRSRSRCRTSARWWSGRRRRGSPSAARTGAGSSRSGSVPAGCSGAATAPLQDGHSGPRSSFPSAIGGIFA